MRIDYIKIKNFRSIKDEITVKLSPNKTVIVGQNNAGKTNIITALDILFGEKYPTSYSLKEKDFFNLNEQLEIEVKIVEINDKDYLNFKWNERYANRDKEKVKNNGELICRFKAYMEEDEIKREYEIYSGEDKIYSKNNDFRKSLLSFVFVPADRTIRADLKAGEYNWYGKLLREILETQTKTVLYQQLVEKLREIEDLVKEILKSESVLKTGQLLTFIEDLKFSLTKGQNPKDLLKYIEILIKGDTEDYFELSRFGHGTQSAILIGLLELYLNLISQSRNSVLRVFAIDEPENFLHPQGKRLINLLLEKISQNENTQVIYTTHSSELITNFEEGKFTLKDVVYVYKEDGLTKIRQFTEEESKELFKIQEEFDVEKGEIFFASGVILVEGETEKHSIPLIYRYHSWNIDDLPVQFKDKYQNPSTFFDLDMQNISVIRVGGIDNIPKYFKFAVKILGKGKVAVVVDKDSNFETKIKPKLKKLIKSIFNEDSEHFEKYGIFVLSKGEFEHYYKRDVIKEFLQNIINSNIKNCEDIISITDSQKKQEVIKKRKRGKLSHLKEDIKKLDQSHKLSKAYEDLFDKYIKGLTKPAIAFKLTKYLLKNNGFDDEIFDILKKIIFYLKHCEDEQR